jgi:hypothetical protein
MTLFHYSLERSHKTGLTVTEILLKVVLCTITLTLLCYFCKKKMTSLKHKWWVKNELQVSVIHTISVCTILICIVLQLVKYKMYCHSLLIKKEKKWKRGFIRRVARKNCFYESSNLVCPLTKQYVSLLTTFFYRLILDSKYLYVLATKWLAGTYSVTHVRNSEIKQLRPLYFAMLWDIDLIFDKWVYNDKLQIKCTFRSGSMIFGRVMALGLWNLAKYLVVTTLFHYDLRYWLDFWNESV